MRSIDSRNGHIPWLQEHLLPKEIEAVLEAQVVARDAETGALTVPSALHGLVRDDPGTREEFLTLTGGRG
jgi:GTP cyclohydrolase I